jgi:hypothetical protein
LFKEFNLALDMVNSSKLPISKTAFTVNTNDLSVLKLIFEITEDDDPINLAGASVRLAVKKPDNTSVFQDCTITDAANGVCEIVLDTQAYLIDGVHYAEVMVFPGSGIVSVTSRFSYRSVKGIMDDSSIVSTNEFQAISSLVYDAEKFVAATNEWEWTATAGQLTYVLPTNATYDTGTKWFNVVVGGAAIPLSSVSKDSPTQFTLLLPSSSIPAGVKVVARWVDSYIPATQGHHATHEVGGYDEIDVTKLKNYQSQIATPLAEIATSVKSFGARGDGVTDDTVAIQNAIDYCVNNKRDVYFPSGNYITTSELVITGFVRFYGIGKNSIIQSNGNNDNIIKVQFSTPTTLDYNFSNLEIRDITINGNSSATTQNAICFNSVITIYNKLKNIRINNVNGSAIRIINDGSRTQKSFYAHNVYWTGIYLSYVSEFLTQDTINNGVKPWVMGGELSDIHMEGASSFRSKSYIFDLNGFHNMNIKDMITEGNVNTSFTSVYHCTDNAIFTNVYFEFILGNGVTVDSYFDLIAGQYKIINPVNLKNSCVRTTAKNTMVEIIGGSSGNINGLNHPSSLGKITFRNITFGDWLTGLPQDDVIPYSNQSISMTDLNTGNYTFSKNDYSEVYRLDKGAYVSNFFGDSIASRFNSGTMPTMSIVEDPIYGRCIKFVPVDSNNAVFAGVKLTFGTQNIGKNITIIARYKWQSTSLQITSPNLIGSYQNILMDDNAVVNDTWRVSAQLANVDNSGNAYVRFDFNNGQTYTVPQNLYVSEILVVWGSVVPTLPLKDDRPIRMYGSVSPTIVGTFMLGDECLNDLTVDATIHKWVYTSQGWKAVKLDIGTSNLITGNFELDIPSGGQFVVKDKSSNDGQIRMTVDATNNYIQSGHQSVSDGKNLIVAGIGGTNIPTTTFQTNNAVFTGTIKENGSLLSAKYAPIMVAVPASSTSSGTAGQMAQDGNFIYICTATNTWKRVAVVSW